MCRWRAYCGTARPFGTRAGGLDVETRRSQPNSRGGSLRSRHQTPRLAQAVRRHIAVNRLVLACLHQISLMPDAGPAAPSDSAPILAPDIHVRIVLIPGER